MWSGCGAVLRSFHSASASPLNTSAPRIEAVCRRAGRQCAVRSGGNYILIYLVRPTLLLPKHEKWWQKVILEFILLFLLDLFTYCTYFSICSCPQYLISPTAIQCKLNVEDGEQYHWSESRILVTMMLLGCCATCLRRRGKFFFSCTPCEM